VAAVALVAVRLARPWTAALPGLVGGTLVGLTLRPGPGPTGPGEAGPDPGQAGTPPPDAGPPGGGR
jgi:hypothetical protein